VDLYFLTLHLSAHMFTLLKLTLKMEAAYISETNTHYQTYAYTHPHIKQMHTSQNPHITKPTQPHTHTHTLNKCTHTHTHTSQNPHTRTYTHPLITQTHTCTYTHQHNTKQQHKIIISLNVGTEQIRYIFSIVPF
jgi:hypothetical protein